MTVSLFQAEHSDMRVTLTLKPNSVPDFGFKTVWDSQGARIKTVQPGKICNFTVIYCVIVVMDNNGFCLVKAVMEAVILLCANTCFVCSPTIYSSVWFVD